MTSPADEPTIARHVRVIGRVQGVFFRGWTKEQADALGVAGWVRNCPDGSVEALLSGAAPAVAELVERMRHGPPGAVVAGLEATEATPAASRDFSILRN